MKKLMLLLLFAASLNVGFSQNSIPSFDAGHHKHDGFFLSMALGPNFANVKSSFIDNSSPTEIKFSGTGAQFDLKIGGAIKENFILHATFLSNSMSGFNVENNSGESGDVPNDVSLGESLTGGGFTVYMMPANTFISASAGVGRFMMIDNSSSSGGIIKSDGGFALQIKVGKEWWVSKNWGLGIGLSYLGTKVTNEPKNEPVEKLKSNNFGIVFNATFN